MVPPPGRDPKSQAPKACALSIGRRIETWYGYEDSNPNNWFRRPEPYPLDDTRITWLDRGESNSRKMSHNHPLFPPSYGPHKIWRGRRSSNPRLLGFNHRYSISAN